MKFSKKAIIFYICFALLMLVLGSSDSLRGVFAPIFSDHFVISTAGISMIVTVSYIGNLAFMLLGGRLADSFGIKKIFAASLFCLICAMALYVVTDNYYILLVGVFFSMGASTLLNMLMNIMSPILFMAPGMIINTLFFIQYIGTTVCQGVIGGMVRTFIHWKLVNAVLILLSGIALSAFMILSKDEDGLKKVPSETASKSASHISYRAILKQPIFCMFVFTFGLYFIAEHGVMNWMNIYCRDWLHMSRSRSALMPSLFSAGIMIGRLVLAPLVTKLGIREMLTYCMILGSVVYCIPFLSGGAFMYLLFPAGLCFSIIYPTLTMCIQLFYPKEITTTASGTILAAGTVFDILFNACFGRLTDMIGYGYAMKILPAAMFLCMGLYIVMIRTNEPIREV